MSSRKRTKSNHRGRPASHPTSRPALRPSGRPAVPVHVSHGGVEYVVTPERSARAVLHEGHKATFLRDLLGPVQWAKYQATEPTAADLGAFANAIADAMVAQA